MSRVLQHDQPIEFGPFRLDPSRRMLQHGDTPTTLRPKTLQVLLHLLHHPRRLVPKDELIATVWEGRAVSDYVLTTCISELRTALGDDPRRPRYIKTLHGAGYQLLVEASVPGQGPGREGRGSRAAAIVGRSRERQRLRRLLDEARDGERRVVFVSGEMGVGKTTLVEAFLHEVAGGAPTRTAVLAGDAAAALVARGHCIEHFGAGEPYMPVLEAIGHLGCERDGAFVVDTMRRHAPAWLVQIPRLASAETGIAPPNEASAPTQAAMRRQMADAVEALGAQRLFVLLLEDLHLSDPATLELIAVIAKRRGPSRLLVLGTMRTGAWHGGIAHLQGLVPDLVLHQQAEEIALAPLARPAVATFLSRRFPGMGIPEDVATTIHGRTEGNPLFLSQLVDQLVADGLLRVDQDAAELRSDVGRITQQVPRTVRAMVEHRVDAMSEEERTLLEVASVAGVSFRSQDLVAAAGFDRERVERLCSQIGRRTGFIGVADPAVGVDEDRYAFRHGLYQQVLYERIEPARRQRLHRAIGGSFAAGGSVPTGASAAELAFHFDRGGDLERAVDWYDKAAASAVARAAHREAVGFLDRGLELLQACRDDALHRQMQLDLLLTRGPLALAIHGYGADDVLDNYRRSLELARQIGNAIPEISSLLALAIGELARADLQTAERLANELVGVAEQAGLPPPIVAQLRNPLSQVRLYQGRVAESLELADAAVAAIAVLALPQPPPGARPALWAEPRVLIHCQRAAASFAMGLTAQAGAAIDQALAIAREVRHPFNLTYALCYASLYEATVGRWEAAVGLARLAIETGEKYEVRFWTAVARIYGGYALAGGGQPDEGLPLLRRGLAEWRGSGGRLMMSLMQNLLAEASLAAGDVDAAEAALAASQEHSEPTGEVVFRAETLRLQAECLRRRGAAAAVQEKGCVVPWMWRASRAPGCGSCERHGRCTGCVRARSRLRLWRRSAGILPASR